MELDPKAKGTIVADDEEFAIDDHVVLEGFDDIKSAILTGRTDIVRRILSVAQSYREEELLFSEDDEKEETKKQQEEGEFLDLLQLLLNFKDNDSGTLLHYATKLGHADIVRTLLSVGANPTIKDQKDCMPYAYCNTDALNNAYVGELMQAVARSRIYRVKRLLQAGVDVNSGDGADSDNKILHWAVTFADLSMISLLLENGADPNVLNGDGSSPLHDAIVRGDPTIVRELLQHGAFANVVPFKGPLEGKSAYDLTVDKPELRGILQEYIMTAAYGNINGSSDGGNDSGTENESFSPLNSKFSLVPIDEFPSHDSVSSIDDKEESVLDRQDSVKSGTSTVSFRPVLLPPTPKMKLFFPTLIQLDPSVSLLWPPPQKISQFKGTYYVPPLNLTIQLISTMDVSESVFSEFENIINVMRPKFHAIGFEIETDFGVHGCSCSKGVVQCLLDSSTFLHDEEYRIRVSTEKVQLIARSTKSLFYSLNTFLQCLRIFQGRGLPLLQINDWPSMRVRGVLLDFSMADVPRMSILCSLVDTLSVFKINQLHVPTDMFDLGHGGQPKLSRSDLLKLLDCCRKRYIEVVPVIRWQNEADANMEDNLVFIRTKVLPLFSFSRYLNILLPTSCHTFDTGQSLLAGVQDNNMWKQFDELHQFCVSCGVTLLINADVPLQQPNKLTTFVHNLACMNYMEKRDAETISEHLADLGVPFIECSSCRESERILSDIHVALQDVHSSFNMATRHNALGIITCYKADASQLSSLLVDTSSLYIGAGASWKSTPTLTCDRAMIANVINRHAYQDHSDLIGSMLLELDELEHKRSLKDGIPYSALYRLLVKPNSLDLKWISQSDIQATTTLLKQCQSQIQNMKLKCEYENLIVEGFSIFIKVLLLICRLCVYLLKAKASDEEIMVEDLPKVHRSDLSNKLMSLIEYHTKFCSAIYIGSSETLASVGILKSLLHKLYPEQANNIQNVKGAFVI